MQVVFLFTAFGEDDLMGVSEQRRECPYRTDRVLCECREDYVYYSNVHVN